MLEALRTLTTQITTAKSATEIGAALFAISNRYGFTTGLGLDVRKLFDDFGESILYAGQRDAVLILNAERPISQHPLVLHARTTAQPFLMSQVRIENNLSEEQWWTLFPDYFRGFDGIVVPVHDNGRLAWYTAFAGAHPTISPAVTALLSVGAHAGYERFGQLLNRKAADSPLTEREAECLELVAQGKTDSEIGAELKISPRTVRFHVGNAKAKLGVTTRIQAVAKQLGAA